MKNCEILPPRVEDKKLDIATEDKPSLKTVESSETIKTPNTDAVPKNEPEKQIDVTNQGPEPSAEATVAGSSSSTKTSTKTADMARPATSRGVAHTRPDRSDSMSRQQVEERHLQVVELLTRQLALNDPTSSVHHAPSAAQSVAFAAPASNSGRGGAGPVTTRASAPPMWLDGAIGAVIIALASLIFRKVM